MPCPTDIMFSEITALEKRNFLVIFQADNKRLPVSSDLCLTDLLPLLLGEKETLQALQDHKKMWEGMGFKKPRCFMLVKTGDSILFYKPGRTNV